jgi:hypothetical protein
LRPALSGRARDRPVDDRTHEKGILVFDGFPQTCDGGGVPTKNLADDVRIEDVAGRSGVDGTQPHAGATQERVEIVPPLLAAIIGLGRDPDEPPP